MLKISLPNSVQDNGVKKTDDETCGEMIEKLATNKKNGKLFRFKNLGKIKKIDKTKNCKKSSF